MRTRSRALKAAVLALSLPMLAAGADDRVDTGGSGVRKTVLATDRDGEVRREIYVEGDPDMEKASLALPLVPAISFIDSPNVECAQPDPRKNDCYVNWGYAYVTASASNYMLDMWFVLDGRVTGRVNGFFQTAMYIPASLTGRGVRVPCGPPVDDPGSCTAPCTPVKVGNSYPWQVKALESGGLRAANYGTATCPAFMGASFFTLPPCRVLDTRSTPSGPLAGPALQPGATRAFELSAAACGIPSGAWAVSVNTTVTAPTNNGSLTLYPGDEATPVATSINFSPGKTRANNAVVPLASDFSGKVKVKNGSTGTVHLILDVNGYFK